MDALEGNIVRAIDVGYGNVKFTTSHDDAFGKIECSQFPSRSPIAGDKGIAAGLLQGRKTVVVDVNGTNYEVGYDVVKAQGTFDETSVLNKDFCLSDAYMARLKGALAYIKMDASFTGDNLALLVLGLPVSTFRNEQLRNKLKQRVLGTHDLPDGKVIKVERVLVMPQPMGAYFEYAFEHSMFEKMQEQNNLIIDPGFLTFDWLMSAGLVPIDARSDSVNRGMSSVLKAVAEESKRKEGWETDVSLLVKLLEEHFRLGRPYNVYGVERDVSNYIGPGKAIINEAVAALGNSVGDGADIQNIILSGGGAVLYLDAIKEKFKHHKIIVMENPVFSNVRGFQLAGEQQLLRAIRAKRKG